MTFSSALSSHLPSPPDDLRSIDLTQIPGRKKNHRPDEWTGARNYYKSIGQPYYGRSKPKKRQVGEGTGTLAAVGLQDQNQVLNYVYDAGSVKITVTGRSGEVPFF